MTSSTPVKKVPIHLQSSQNRLIIKYGKVVNEDEIIEEDVFIEDGIIKQIGKNLIIPGGTRIIDARGKFVIPGGIDPNTHFQAEYNGLTSVDDFYQGTKAAVAGGTTMIIDTVVPKTGESILDSFYEYRQKADQKVCCDYSLHVAIPSWSEQVKKEMEILCKEHGINSFQLFMAYKFMLNDSELYSAIEECSKLGAIAQVHAENGHLIAKNIEKILARGFTGPEGHELARPEVVEAEAVNRACVIAEQVGAPIYLLRVSSESSGEVLANRRSKGFAVFGEVEVANVAANGQPRTAYTVTSPPIRSNPESSSQLLNLIVSDVLQVTASDHCTFNKSQKETGKSDFSKIPPGVNGVEERMSILWEKAVHNGFIDPCKFVALTSTNAAKIFNLYPRKGYIGVGSDADIVVWNPKASKKITARTHNLNTDFNVFEGMDCHGVPEYVIVNGRVCVDDGQLRAVQGHGKFVETQINAPYVYNPEKFQTLKPTKQNDIFGMERTIDKLAFEPIPTPTIPESVVGTPSMRGPKPEGQRNMQESTFSVSEDLDVERKSCIRVKNPPGGKSSGFW